MNGRGHYALGASAGLLYAQVAHLEWWQWPVAIGLSAGFSHGWVSPDIDNSPLWHWLDRWTPDELLGNKGPMRHRGITHWWGTHLALSVALYVCHPSWWWMGGAVLAGWWSHLIGDAAIGARGQGRGAGIPLMPWWCHIGLGFKCGGWAEATVAFLAPIAVLGWTVWSYLPDTHTIMAGIGL